MRRLIVAVIGVLVLCPTVFSDELKIASQSGPAVQLVCKKSRLEAERHALYLYDWLAERGFSVKPDLARSVDPDANHPQWVLGLADDQELVGGTVDWPSFASSARDEAFVLDASESKAGPCLLLVANASSGVRAATMRLLGKVVNHGDQLTIESGREACDPFIRKRVICLCPSARRQMPFTSPYKAADYETWPAERIREYPGLFEQFGFNGLQMVEIRGYGSCCGQDVDAERLPRVRRAALMLAQGAADRDMWVSQFIWGDCLYSEGEAYCWNEPAQHAEMLEYMDYHARTYGQWVDHINVHIGDPGGCTRNGCDHYKTPQLVASAWVDAYRKANAEIDGTLSTWANGFFWKHHPGPIDVSNYAPFFHWMFDDGRFGLPIPDGATFLDESFSSADLGIALNRRYNEAQAKEIEKAGRAVDVWNWYTGDIETINNLWIMRNTIEDVFGSLPDSARELVRSHTVELCFHGWPNLINTYSAAQKMWNPRRSLDEIELEFCRAVYGPDNAESMQSLYHACGHSSFAAIPQPPDFGTSGYNDRLRSILADADSIDWPADWKPNFSLMAPRTGCETEMDVVGRFVEMMKARAQLILAVSVAKQTIERKREEIGVSKEEPSAASALSIQVVDNNGTVLIPLNAGQVPLPLEPGHTLGQTFRVMKDFSQVGVACPTWGTADSGLTISLYDAPGGNLLASREVVNHVDNSVLSLSTNQSAGFYYVELSNPIGSRIGVWALKNPLQDDAQIYVDGKAQAGEPEAIRRLKRELIEQLPHLPIDPLYPRQTDDIAHPSWRTHSFKTMIENL